MADKNDSETRGEQHAASVDKDSLFTNYAPISSRAFATSLILELLGGLCNTAGSSSSRLPAQRLRLSSCIAWCTGTWHAALLVHVSPRSLSRRSCVPLLLFAVSVCCLQAP